jgi:hypothetical protein
MSHPTLHHSAVCDVCDRRLPSLVDLFRRLFRRHGQAIGS